MIEAFPLCWPPDYPRTNNQINSRFKTTLAKARDYVKDEIRRIKGKDPIISTYIPLKNDGDLRADWTRFKIDDTGVAVYFIRNGHQVVLCCDRYTRVWENLHAIGRTIEAFRQIDRDGVSDFLDRTFTGFKALPEKIEQRTWCEVLGVQSWATKEDIKNAYLIKAKIHHPDAGGNPSAFDELNKAYKQGLAQIK